MHQQIFYGNVFRIMSLFSTMLIWSTSPAFRHHLNLNAFQPWPPFCIVIGKLMLVIVCKVLKSSRDVLHESTLYSHSKQPNYVIPSFIRIQIHSKVIMYMHFSRSQLLLLLTLAHNKLLGCNKAFDLNPLWPYLWSWSHSPQVTT